MSTTRVFRVGAASARRYREGHAPTRSRLRRQSLKVAQKFGVVVVLLDEHDETEVDRFKAPPAVAPEADRTDTAWPPAVTVRPAVGYWDEPDTRVDWPTFEASP